MLNTTAFPKTIGSSFPHYYTFNLFYLPFQISEHLIGLKMYYIPKGLEEISAVVRPSSLYLLSKTYGQMSFSK
jgi:hypothetical protein